MAFINPGVPKKSPIYLLILLVAQVLCAQEAHQPITRFSQPTLKEINTLVESYQYKKAIALSLTKAQQMKAERNWEGYLFYILRAAEIETFEVWKAQSHPEIKIEPDYRRALAYLDSLYKYGARYIDEYPYLKANALFTSAVVYDWLNRPDTAEQMHRTALDLRIQLYGKNSREVADSYVWMGVLYNWGLNRKDWAKQYYLNAVELQKQYMPHSRYALGTAYYGLAILARKRYEFDEAVAMAYQYSALYKDLPFEQASARQLIANTYAEQGNFEKSLKERTEAIRIYERSGFNEQLILAYSNLSDDLRGLGRNEEALGALKKALNILNRNKNKNILYEKGLYENLGEIYRLTGQYDSAEFYLNRSLQIASAHFGKHNEEVADVYKLRGDLYIDQEKLKESLDDYQQMLTSVIPDFDPKDIFETPEIQKESPYFITIITAQFSKGDAFFKWYDHEKKTTYLEQALNHYRAAYNQLIEGRKTIGDDLSKPFLMQNFETSVEKSIQCAKKLHELTKEQHFLQDIFHFIELTKYLNVLDALQRAERANNSGVPKSLLFELEDVRNELNRLQKEILRAEGLTKDSVTQLNAKVLDLMNRRRELMTQISSYPDHATNSMDNTLLGINEVQQKLSSDDQVLEYFWGADSIYVLSITHQKTSISSITPTFGIDSLITSVYHRVSGNNSFKKEDIKKFSDESSAIYKKLFAPFIQKKRLIILPDGPLSIVPVEALVVEPKPEANTYGLLDYSIYHNEISYAYSASILFKNREIKKKSIENVLAFSYSNGAEGPNIAWRSQQGELPGTYKELEALSRIFKNVKRFTDRDASKKNFINNTADSDIIHLGVHGIGDEEVADNSRLIFRRDSLNEAELYAYEIYNLNLNAGLVVLSACESGLGRNQRGEGMFSIARAFTYAGCPASVMSLWKARDTFTAEIMIRFYENLNHGKPISSSLRNAKLQFLKEADGLTAHPANWAAFVLNGQDLEFEENSVSKYLLYGLVTVLLLSALFMYLKRRS